jgi:hypothetical protein
LKDVITKMRSKLKVLEEMAASSKLQKVDSASGGNVAAVIRNVLHNMQASIDRLEYNSQKQSKVLNYLLNIKQTVKRPIMAFQQKLSEVIALRDGTSIAEAKHALQEAELQCQAIKKAPAHARVAQIEKEVRMIECFVGDMVKPIRDIVQLMNASAGAGGGGGGKQGGGQHAASAGGARSSEWAKSLRTLMAGVDSDLLERCKNK